jgi:DNA polymerase
MADSYLKLLDATIQHLERLNAQGVRYVAVSPETMKMLTSQPAKARAGNVMSSNTGPTSRSQPNPTIHTAARAEPQASTSVTMLSSAQGASLAQSDFSPNPVPGPEAKAAAFADLRRRALACVRCPNLAASRKNVVFGVGDPAAQLMFVGEAPGADEDQQGEPFVGMAGQLLTKIIQTMGLSRNSVYIANILKCRPDTPGHTSGNRKPAPEEMQTCIPFLHEQIDLIQPKVIVALGATAVEGLLGKTTGITRLRGNWRTYRGIPLMPTYHPAYLLRNQALSEKRRVWEDMLQVMDRLALPVSEKQRNYFL